MRHAQWFASRFRQAFGPKAGPIGLEFRDGFVRMVQVARDRRADVLAAACVAYDRRGPGLSIAHSMEPVVHALLGGSFRGRACVVVLPFEAARVETFTVPEGDDAAIQADVARTLAHGHGSVETRDPEFGFVRLGPVGHARCEVAAVVADRRLIESIVNPLIDSGFWPTAVEPSFTAVARACCRTHRRAADRGRVRLAVDLHEGGATALLLQGQTIVYASSASSRSRVPDALGACCTEARRVFGTEPPTEVRIVGSRAYDVDLQHQIERSCGLPVLHDDDAGTFASAFAEIGVRAIDSAASGQHAAATDSGGAAAWMGAFGAAFRGLSRAELRQSGTDQRPAHRREAA
ncbi:MAG: hypothetical protein JNL80_12180 [Phycisphaerae bacterium]|jgi:hypothetical protein|nr:hypothetical protein [Phycisphaerae bacterium]